MPGHTAQVEPRPQAHNSDVARKLLLVVFLVSSQDSPFFPSQVGGLLGTRGYSKKEFRPWRALLVAGNCPGPRCLLFPRFITPPSLFGNTASVSKLQKALSTASLTCSSSTQLPEKQVKIQIIGGATGGLWRGWVMAAR